MADRPPPSPEPRGLPSEAASRAQRRAWARERLEDAAKLLPILGLALVLLPDLVLSGSDAAAGATLPWGVTLISVWVALILLAALIGRALRRQAGADGEDGPPQA